MSALTTFLARMHHVPVQWLSNSPNFINDLSNRSRRRIGTDGRRIRHAGNYANNAKCSTVHNILYLADGSFDSYCTNPDVNETRMNKHRERA